MNTNDRTTVRVLIRYAIVMAIVGVLIGISYQESAKKLSFTSMPGGEHLEAVIHLALVHGHVFTIGVLLPLGLAGALVLAGKTGGSELPRWAHLSLRPGYLTFASLSLALNLYKGYHFLLMARGGEQDFAVIDEGFFGGVHLLRYTVYAVVHGGMGVTLVAFLVALWRSLDSK